MSEKYGAGTQAIINGYDIPGSMWSAVGATRGPTGTICTATFVDRRCILLAAHCGTPWTMVLGASAFPEDPETKSDLVLRSMVHPPYQPLGTFRDTDAHTYGVTANSGMGANGPETYYAATTEPSNASFLAHF